MKKKLLTLVTGVMMAAAVLAGCGSGGGSGSSSSEGAAVSASADEYVFEANGTKIQMNAKTDSILAALGEEKDYFEAESCAFQGLDKTYTYSGFRLYTYPIEEEDFVATVELMDDTVKTAEGVRIGDSADKVEEAYGDDYAGEGSARVYTKGKSQLKFIISDDVVSSIEYLAITE